jgi:peptidoglycan/LPS O-acetylase OafA/YrhL
MSDAMTDVSRPTTLTRVAALDGLRGVAVTGVLLFHGGHLTGGYLGVDLFFVLSGFLITSLLLAESQASGKISFGNFWARRARRLLPALAGLLVGVAVYCAVFAKPDELAQIRGDALATVGYVANWRAVFARQDYWALFQTPSPLQHTWSLAIEEQFYLVWPLVFAAILAWRKVRTPVAVLTTAAIGVAVSSGLMAWFFDNSDISRAYYGTDTRASAIFVGVALAAALALWGPARGNASRVVLEGAGLTACVFLGWAWVRVSGQSSFLYHGGFLLCGVAAVTVIAAATHPRRGPIARVLGLRPLCVLGLVSYGVYLWHWPVYVVLDQTRTGLSDPALLAARLTVTFAIAAVSYLALEMPIRRGALSARRGRFVIPAVATALVGAMVVTTAGATPRISVAEAKPELVQSAVRRAASAPRGVRRVMVVGNSVGWFIGTAIEHSAIAPPVVGFNAAQPSCAFPSGVTQLRYPSGDVMPTQRCDEQWDTGIRRFRPNVVLWIQSPTTAEAFYNSKWTRLCAPDFDSQYRVDLERAVRQLSATGARVVITTSAYLRYVLAPPGDDRFVDCDNRIRREVARDTGAQLVDLFSYTCPDGQCRDKIDGEPMRPDGLHYEGPSARIVARWILDQVPAPRTGQKPRLHARLVSGTGP